LDDLKDLYGRSVDLVMVTAIDNPYFWRTIEKTRTVLFDAA